jgi:hypothetical protein
VTDTTDGTLGDEDTGIGSVCVSGLAPGNYTVNEVSPPEGYGGATQTDVVVTVANGTNCTDNLPDETATATFTNVPLSDIQLRFRDGGSGETSLLKPISCDNTTGASDTADTTDWNDTLTISDVEAPATITCTFEIDP